MQNQLEFREIVPFFLDCIKQLGCQESDILKQDFDIACKCPVCGDSRTRRNLKRLHLYQKGDVINVNCFNGDCSVKNMTPYRFFQDYNTRIFEQSLILVHLKLKNLKLLNLITFKIFSRSLRFKILQES